MYCDVRFFMNETLHVTFEISLDFANKEISKCTLIHCLFGRSFPYNITRITYFHIRNCPFSMTSNQNCVLFTSNLKTFASSFYLILIMKLFLFHVELKNKQTETS